MTTLENQDQDKQQPRPWGLWPTIGFSLAIGAVYVFVQGIVVVPFVVVAKIRDPQVDINSLAESLGSNGFCVALATCVSAPFFIGLTVLFAKIRRPMTLTEYLGLRTVGWKELTKWLLALVLFVACHDTLTYLMDRPLVPQFMFTVYETAYFTPLLWLAMVIVAPLSEEVFFRGFLFKGIEYSRFGAVGAVIFTSLAWAIMHLQYDMYGIFALLLGGLLLGYARLKSRSLYVPIAMHTLQNIVATVEVVIWLRIMGNAA
jgi:hypothetical protein